MIRDRLGEAICLGAILLRPVDGELFVLQNILRISNRADSRHRFVGIMLESATHPSLVGKQGSYSDFRDISDFEIIGYHDGHGFSRWQWCYTTV